MKAISNISGYKFCTIDAAEHWRAQLFAKLEALDLLGTILLGTEGVNLNLAGSAEPIQAFITWITSYPLFAGMAFKFSYSEFLPFTKRKVKIKNEIIRMGVAAIDAVNQCGKHLPATTFKLWLEQNKPMIILDTRNDYEYEFGHFKNAIHFNIQHFRQFPERALQLGARTLPIVTYCTGGIRCEKATLLLQQLGYHDVYQLEGGILKYFEDCGGKYYHGECFVFDDRIALDPQLKVTATKQCLACRGPIFPNQPTHSCKNEEIYES